MLTDKEGSKHRVMNRNKPGGWYPDNIKMDAVKLWLVTGNLRGTAAALNIPYYTVKTWRYSKWWSDLANELRTENTIQLSNKLKKIAEKALDVTLDRLENGDYIYDQKTGQLVRKPVVMRDAALVANTFTDKHIKLEEKPHKDQDTQQIKDRLSELAEAFANMAKKSTKIEVVDV